MRNQDGTPHFQVIINGTNRYERALEALLPANIMIDSNEIIDRVFYTLKMSESYKHYDLTGNNDCSWDSLLVKNIYFQLASIYKYDFVKQINGNEAGLILSDNLSGTGKKELKKYIQTLADDLKGSVTACTSTDGAIIRELCSWISCFEPYKDGEFKTFYSYLTIAKKEASQINEILLGILKRFDHESAVDILFEFNDAISKLKRYFYSISNLAKSEFYKQLAADNNIEGHISLFFGFLQLFNTQTAQLNSLTAKHLDYCYSQLMGLKQKSPIADQVYVSFTVADKMSPYTVAAATNLDAGKDGNGMPIVFATDQEINVNNTTVGNIKTLFINHFSAFSNTENLKNPGIGLETFTADTKTIPDFNQEAAKLLIGPVNASSINASSISSSADSPGNFTDEDLGFVIASPLLYIEDGSANVTLTIDLNLAEDFLYQAHFKQISSQPFSLYVTTASGWLKVDSYLFTANASSIILSFSNYDAVKSPIVSYDPKVYTEGYTIKTPALKINMHREHDGDANPYLYMRYLIISKIQIQVDVTDHKKFKIQTNVGTVNPTSPFQAFGPIPQVGGYFSMRNANIFNRYLNSFNINVGWMPLPPKRNGFDNYYEKYNLNPYKGGLFNHAFKVTLQALDGNNYDSLQMRPTEFQLFNIENHLLKNQSILKVNKNSAGKTLGFNNDVSLSAEKNLDFSMPGSIRLTLTSPPSGFGFALYPSVLSNAITENARTNLIQWIRNGFRLTLKKPSAVANKPADSQEPEPQQKLPNQPFIPVIKSIALGYSLNQSKTLDNTVFKPDDDIAVIHINPFGYKTIYPNPAQDTCYLMPQFTSGNNLFIGLSNLSTAYPLNLLFTLNETVIENNFITPTPVSWYYLKDNDWILIEDENINSDSTNRFTKNGIVKLNVPAGITLTNTVMPPDFSWILAAVAEDDLENKMIRNLSTIIYSAVNNATSATRQISGSGSADIVTLPPGSVKGLITRVPQITAITQPLPSFGGSGAEDSDSFYLRISERLRHKARPLSAWELERIVLDKFPEIRYAKCINFKANAWHMPNLDQQADMLMIVVGDVYYSPTSSIQVPYTTLSNIQAYLEEIINANLNIVVSNPHVERLKIKCDITFKDNDLSKEKNLEADFASYLNPWMDNQSKKVKINTTIYKSDLLGYLRNRPYVVDIKNLVIIHIFERGLMADTGVDPPGSKAQTDYFLVETADDGAITTYLPYGMFVSSPPHILLPIKKGGGRQPKFMGLGEMIVSDDFRIREEQGGGQPAPTSQTDISNEELSFIIDID